ncbi:MAG: SPOR domain-containing protein [Deltaproteobacteria bacterium]|nr:SPOR domain-containing protein [Deltaproteobacteria bacterium]
MTENRKGKIRGAFYFTRAQLFLLAAGFTAASAVVFCLGIFIGQKIEEGKLIKKDEPLVKIPVEPQEGASKGLASKKEEITFYDALTKGSSRPQPPVEPRVAANPAQKESNPVVKAPQPLSKGEAENKPAARQEKPVSAEAPAAEAQWKVQVNAYPNETDANNLAKKLTEKGYAAYVVSTNFKGKTWYRVRVGQFATREEAKQLQETLHRKENLTNAIILTR